MTHSTFQNIFDTLTWKYPNERNSHIKSKSNRFPDVADINQNLEAGTLKCVSQLYHELQSLACLTLKWTELLNWFPSVQFSSVAQSCLTLCDPMNRSMPGLPVHHQLPEFTQTHVHRVGDAIQPSHPLSSSSPPAPNPSQHQSLFQWVNSSHEVAKVLGFQL